MEKEKTLTQIKQAIKQTGKTFPRDVSLLLCLRVQIKGE
jgi:hypothetical protein